MSVWDGTHYSKWWNGFSKTIFWRQNINSFYIHTYIHIVYTCIRIAKNKTQLININRLFRESPKTRSFWCWFWIKFHKLHSSINYPSWFVCGTPFSCLAAVNNFMNFVNNRSSFSASVFYRPFISWLKSIPICHSVQKKLQLSKFHEGISGEKSGKSHCRPYVARYSSSNLWNASIFPIRGTVPDHS